MSGWMSRSQSIVLGLAVVVALSLAVLGLRAVGSRNMLWGKHFEVQSQFPSVRGVEIGTRVRVQGVDAGEVTAILPPTKAGGPVLVRMRLKDDYRVLVRRDGHATISSEGMLGGKVIDIDPGSPTEPPADDLAMLASRPGKELGDVLDKAGATLQGEGTIGRLATDPTLYNESVEAMQQAQDTLGGVQRGVGALQGLPLVGKSLRGAREILDREGCERNRKVFPEHALFEPGRAALKGNGNEQLQSLVPWLEGLARHKGAEVVVVAYADPQTARDAAHARRVSEDQARRVGDELAGMARVWFGLKSRSVTTLGMGTAPPPVPERTSLPPARVEVIVFVPQ